MFNNSLKKNALAVYEEAVKNYDNTHRRLTDSCNDLYNIRSRTLSQIRIAEELINSIANTPKEFEKEFGTVKEHVTQFNDAERFAEESYKDMATSGVGIAAGLVAGGAVAGLGPSAMMSFATTFGKATTGRAVKSLAGAAAEKAAIGWIGRVTGGIATKGVVAGSGYAAGKAFLAIAGPIGWSITAATTGASLVSLTRKNKELADKAVAEAKDVMTARGMIQETLTKVTDLYRRMYALKEGLGIQLVKADKYRSADYLSLSEEAQMELGTIVNNTSSLAALLTETVE